MGRGLKNWIVTAEGIKKGENGIVAYFNYLNSQSEHQNQKIVNLFSEDGAQQLFNICKKANQFNLARKLNKGGRPSNNGWSAMLAYPFDISTAEMAQIMRYNIIGLIKFISEKNKLDLSQDEIEKIANNQVIAIQHSGQNINSHTHLIMPQHFQKGKDIVSINLTEKKYSHRLKLLNNEAVELFCGRKSLDYKIENQKITKTRISKTKYKENQAHKEAIAEATETAIQAVKNEIVMPTLTKLENFVLGLKKSNPDSLDLQIAEKLLSTYKAQMNNGNTQRAEKTAEKVLNLGRKI